MVDTRGISRGRIGCVGETRTGRTLTQCGANEKAARITEIRRVRIDQVTLRFRRPYWYGRPTHDRTAAEHPVAAIARDGCGDRGRPRAACGVRPHRLRGRV